MFAAAVLRPGGCFTLLLADFYTDGAGRPVRLAVDDLVDALAAVGIYPVNDKTIGRQQTQPLGFFDRLQGAQVHVDLLFAEIRFKSLYALIPEGSLHCRESGYMSSFIVFFQRSGRASLYLLC